MDRGAWRATVPRVSKSHTQLKQLITQVRRSSLRCIITVKNQKQGRLLKELVTSAIKQSEDLSGETLQARKE